MNEKDVIILKKVGFFLILLVLACLVFYKGIYSAEGETKVYPDRWVYVSRGLGRDSDVDAIREIVKTASEHGLNGMVLSAGLDSLSRRQPEYLDRLNQIKQICEEYKIEIIPIIFSVGYGSSALNHNLNLAAGLPVKDALFVVKGNEARLFADPPVEIVNGGFEEADGLNFKGYNFHDKPGQISFVDGEVFKTGKSSIRFEHFGEIDPQHGHARVMQEVKVHPYRYYRLTCWAKTDNLRGSFRIQVLTADGRSLAPFDPGIPETTDWRKITMVFNSIEYDLVRIYAGLWGGRSGRLWLDELNIEELGLANVLRRPGTPVRVASDGENPIVYKEGADYEYISDPKLHPWRHPDYDPVPIRIAPNSSIKDGQRLRVSFYHSMAVNRSQVTLCMSEPELYEIYRQEARLLHQYLKPKKYLLSMDEIRAGGSCATCRGRNISMAEILGDCITKQVNIMHENNPGAEIFIWSDMLDPNHNAHGNYYLVDGDFTGSWNYIPKDLRIVCWYYDKRDKSLKFFSDLGFQTVAGAYYDGDTLDNPKGWLESLDQTPGARGIMYTTWQNKYALLADFGDLVMQ